MIIFSRSQMFKLIGFSLLCLSLILFITVEGTHTEICSEIPAVQPDSPPKVGIACNLLGVAFWVAGTIDG